MQEICATLDFKSIPIRFINLLEVGGKEDQSKTEFLNSLTICFATKLKF